MAKHESVHWTCDICNEKCSPLIAPSYRVDGGHKVSVQFSIHDVRPDLCYRCAVEVLKGIVEALEEDDEEVGSE